MITNIKRKFTKYRTILEITIEDSGDNIKVIFFHLANIFEKIFTGKKLVAVSGKVTSAYNHIVIYHPKFDFIENIENPDFLNTGIIVPYYSLKNINQLKEQYFGSYTIRDIIVRAMILYLNKLEETLPDYIIRENNLLDLKNTITSLHAPKSFEDIELAKARMKFEEMFFFQLLSQKTYELNQVKYDNIKFKKIGNRTKEFIDKYLPFELTQDQKKVIKEIYKDFTSGYSMNRLLQGEVGSGKTLIVLISALITVENGFQIAIMAPTEILANQHYDTFVKLLEKLNLNICLITSSTPTKLRKQYLTQITNGEINIVIGTHAIIENDIIFHNLGFVVVDEQHRFGVVQRAKLKEKGINTHFLLMTATPIPRTLSMTIYSGMTISTIKELPKNRKPIKTFLVDELKRERIYNFIRKEINSGNAAYIIYPLIEESEKLNLKDLISNYEKLKSKIFPDLKLGMLHGQMSAEDKNIIMNKFIKNEINILISTTVVEVGIDNPNATIILIEEPQRFGLSQLHQLRGRVGRGEKQSYCILITNEKYINETELTFSFFKTDEETELNNTRRRLNIFVNNLDGFKISEEDLKLRGPGDLLGTKQSGIPEFNYIDLRNDYELILKIKNYVSKILSEDPSLTKKVNSVLNKFITENFSKNIFLSKIS